MFHNMQPMRVRLSGRGADLARAAEALARRGISCTLLPSPEASGAFVRCALPSRGGLLRQIVVPAGDEEFVADVVAGYLERLTGPADPTGFDDEPTRRLDEPRDLDSEPTRPRVVSTPPPPEPAQLEVPAVLRAPEPDATVRSEREPDFDEGSPEPSSSGSIEVLSRPALASLFPRAGHRRWRIVLLAAASASVVAAGAAVGWAIAPDPAITVVTLDDPAARGRARAARVVASAEPPAAVRPEPPPIEAPVAIAASAPEPASIGARVQAQSAPELSGTTLDPDALVAHAESLEREGSLAAARALFARAAELAPRDPHAHAGLARALVSEGALEEAELAARRAVALRPRRAPYRVLLGDVLAAGGQHMAARAAWREALALDPDDTAIRARLGR